MFLSKTLNQLNGFRDFMKPIKKRTLNNLKEGNMDIRNRTLLYNKALIRALFHRRAEIMYYTTLNSKCLRSRAVV